MVGYRNNVINITEVNREYKLRPNGSYMAPQIVQQFLPNKLVPYKNS